MAYVCWVKYTPCMYTQAASFCVCKEQNPVSCVGLALALAALAALDRNMDKQKACLGCEHFWSHELGSVNIIIINSTLLVNHACSIMLQCMSVVVAANMHTSLSCGGRQYAQIPQL